MSSSKPTGQGTGGHRPQLTQNATATWTIPLTISVRWNAAGNAAAQRCRLRSFVEASQVPIIHDGPRNAHMTLGFWNSMTQKRSFTEVDRCR
jgi:hypothetical protein